MQTPDTTFDPLSKEAVLATESMAWDTSRIFEASKDDIPIIDVGPYFAAGSPSKLVSVASQLRYALKEVGFYQLIGHGIPVENLDRILETARRFHGLSLETKRLVLMDRQGNVGGVGYLPVGARKLPARSIGNPNEAFLVKKDPQLGLGLDDNLWLDESRIPGFRRIVEEYTATMEALSIKLLPLYAVALDLEPTFFTEAFTSPLWRLRLTHYPPSPSSNEPLGPFGIPPHVDTTFMTLLLPDSPGLVIFSAKRKVWIRAPSLEPGSLMVNSGELLRQWSNDRVLSTRHFVGPVTGACRYSVPFFFNANSDYRMECLPSCCSPDYPPKYPPMSYRESQGVVQGE